MEDFVSFQSRRLPSLSAEKLVTATPSDILPNQKYLCMALGRTRDGKAVPNFLAVHGTLEAAEAYNKKTSQQEEFQYFDIFAVQMHHFVQFPPPNLLPIHTIIKNTFPNL